VFPTHLFATEVYDVTEAKTYSEEHPEDAIYVDLSPEEIDNLVLYEKVDRHIAVITFNRPDRLNAMLAPHSFLEMRRKFERAEDDDEVKVIVLTGAGRGFCAGVDLRRTPVEDAGLRPGKRLPQSQRMRMPAFKSTDLLFCDKTVIAAVNGPCVAAGFNYMMQCDLVIASTEARFGEPEARIGFAGFSPSFPLVALKCGPNRARALQLTGRLLTPEEFKEWGMVESIVPPEQLMDEALRYARMVAWHSTDNLMLGRKSMQLFYNLMGMNAYRTWTAIAHPLFTNMVWREDEFNFFRERNKHGLREALSEIERQWSEMGF
jgi:enoyl-CoA hydratase/carnithine racemase